MTEPVSAYAPMDTDDFTLGLMMDCWVKIIYRKRRRDDSYKKKTDLRLLIAAEVLKERNLTHDSLVVVGCFHLQRENILNAALQASSQNLMCVFVCFVFLWSRVLLFTSWFKKSEYKKRAVGKACRREEKKRRGD